MKITITLIICLTTLCMTALICRTVLQLDYQKTEQLLEHLDGTSNLRPDFRTDPAPNDHL